jgi:hypothetical protein
VVIAASFGLCASEFEGSSSILRLTSRAHKMENGCEGLASSGIFASRLPICHELDGGRLHDSNGSSIATKETSLGPRIDDVACRRESLCAGSQGR